MLSSNDSLLVEQVLVKDLCIGDLFLCFSKDDTNPRFSRMRFHLVLTKPVERTTNFEIGDNYNYPALKTLSAGGAIGPIGAVSLQCVYMEFRGFDDMYEEVTIFRRSV